MTKTEFNKKWTNFIDESFTGDDLGIFRTFLKMDLVKNQIQEFFEREKQIELDKAIKEFCHEFSKRRR